MSFHINLCNGERFFFNYRNIESLLERSRIISNVRIEQKNHQDASSMFEKLDKCSRRSHMRKLYGLVTTTLECSHSP